MPKATFERDKRGFWTAYIEQPGGVRVRHPLPVPFTATYDQALFAFNALMARLERQHRYERDDYTQPVEAVIAQERAFVVPVPLKAESYRVLFAEWQKANPKAWHEMELIALAIHRRGMRVSTKYLIERQRYEGAYKLQAVPYTDQYGITHHYQINNTITPLIARCLLDANPDMRIEVRKSMFDEPRKDDHK